MGSLVSKEINKSPVRVAACFLSFATAGQSAILGWEVGAPMPAPRYEFEMALLENRGAKGQVMVAGGVDKDDVFVNSVVLYDLATQNWTAGTAMLDARHAFGMVVIPGQATAGGQGKRSSGDVVMVAGGRAKGPSNSWLDSVHMYDVDTQQWAEGTAMPTPRNYFGIVFLPGAGGAKGRVMVAGGSSGAGTGYDDPLYMYDVGTKQWSAGAAMPIKREFVRLVFLPDVGAQGHVMIAGGLDYHSDVANGDLCSVYMYDVASAAWTKAAPMPAMSIASRHLFRMALVHGTGRVLAVGGNGPEYLNTFYEYDVANNTWEGPVLSAALPVGRHSFGMEVLPGNQLMVAGGRDVNDVDLDSVFFSVLPSTTSTITATSATTSNTFATATTATTTTTTNQKKVAGEPSFNGADDGNMDTSKANAADPDLGPDVADNIEPRPGDEDAGAGDPAERSNSGAVVAAVVVPLVAVGILLVGFYRKRKQDKAATMAQKNRIHDGASRCQHCRAKRTHCICKERADSIAARSSKRHVNNHAYVDTPDPTNVHAVVKVKAEWFVGEMGKDDCKARVSGIAAERGSFLVRNSKSKPGAYAFCINLGDGRVQEDLAMPEVDAVAGNATSSLRLYFSKSKKSTQSCSNLQSLVEHCQTHPITPKPGCTLKLGRAAPAMRPKDAATSAGPSDTLSSCTYGEVDSKLLEFYKKMIVVDYHEIYDSSDTSNPLAPLKDARSVSIEEAIRSAETHCGVLPDDYLTDAEKFASMYAKKAKRMKKRSDVHLEAIDIQTIFLYTKPCNLYKQMNAALGKYGEEPDPRANVVHYMPYVKLLTTSLTKLPKVRTIAYRGVTQPCSRLLNGAKVGDTITWWSFTSTTTNTNALKTPEFLGADVRVDTRTKAIVNVRNSEYYSDVAAGRGGHAKGKTIFQIDVCSGVNIKPYSAIPGEDEILLMAGSKFVIKSIKEWRHGITEVRMVQVDVDGDGDGGGSTGWDEIEQYMTFNPDVDPYYSELELSADKPVYSGGLHNDDADDNTYAYDSVI